MVEARESKALSYHPMPVTQPWPLRRLQCQKFPSELQLTMNSDYISSPFQKYGKEIKLHLIALQKSTRCLGSRCHVRSQCTHHPGVCSVPLASDPFPSAEQFVSIRRQLKEHKCTYVISLGTNQVLFMGNKWRIRTLET